MKIGFEWSVCTVEFYEFEIPELQNHLISRVLKNNSKDL